MKLSDFKSSKFKLDSSYKWINEFEHGECAVVKYIEVLDKVDTLFLDKTPQAYQVCEAHNVYRKTPYEQNEPDKLVVDPPWEVFEE